MAKKQYIKTGTCIWCGKKKPEVTFYTRPHIIPQSLGGTDIGFDVCDKCNHYFGKTSTLPSCDLTIKEVFRAFTVFGNNLDENTYKKLKSYFWNYHHSTGRINVKNTFNSKDVTLQFKRGLYEIFLQKYHKETGNGNHPMFNAIRNFARYNKGDLHVHYLYNNIILCPKDEYWEISMSENSINKFMENGVYKFWLGGHIFYMEIFPTAYYSKGLSYLIREANESVLRIRGDEGIFELKDIRDIDFFMQRFNN